MTFVCIGISVATTAFVLMLVIAIDTIRNKIEGERTSELRGIEIARIKDIPEIHNIEVSYVENYEDAIRKPPGAWKDELFPKVLEGIDRCLKITCEKDRKTNNWIFTAKIHVIHPDELFLTIGKEDANETQTMP